MQDNRQRIHGNEQTAKKNHGEAEKVGEGLRLKNFADRHRNKESEKCGGYRDQEDAAQGLEPIYSRKIGREVCQKSGNQGVDDPKNDGPGGFRQHQQL